MCYTARTEFTILAIADYKSELLCRNAHICKRHDESRKFYAVIMPALSAQDELLILPCDDAFTRLKNNPFCAYLPLNKSFSELSANDVIQAMFF